MASKLRVAFVGTGGIATQHLNSVHGFKDCQIVGLCDVNEEALKDKQSRFGGETFTDVGKMLDTVPPEAVYICLPPFAHGAPEMACAKRKIPFFVEKPQALDAVTLKKVAKAVDEAGIITAVGYQNRYRKGVKLARKALLKSPASLICGWWIGGTPQNHPWLGKKRLSGGQTLEQTTHTFDLLRCLCGEAASVFCTAAKGFAARTPSYDSDDASSAVIKMKSGAVANIMSSWTSGRGGGVGLDLYGPGVKVNLKGWEHCLTLLAGKEEAAVEIPGESDIFAIEDRAFLTAVKRQDPSSILCDYADGARSLALSLAANESMKTGKPVRIL